MGSPSVQVFTLDAKILADWALHSTHDADILRTVAQCSAGEDGMSISQRAQSRPFHRICVASGRESFAGGYETMEEATKAAAASNQSASQLNLKDVHYNAIRRPC